jgi:hypothetical protein
MSEISSIVRKAIIAVYKRKCQVRGCQAATLVSRISFLRPARHQ